MDFKCKIICSFGTHRNVDGIEYAINPEEQFIVETQSIDKNKWFVCLPEIQKYDYIEKYYFYFVITNYATYEKQFGEFQLPVIGENLYSYICIPPSGTAVWLHKKDVQIHKYNSVQSISCDEIKLG